MHAEITDFKGNRRSSHVYKKRAEKDFNVLLYLEDLLDFHQRRQNILGPLKQTLSVKGGGGISKSANVDAGGPKISQLITFYWHEIQN